MNGSLLVVAIFVGFIVLLVKASEQSSADDEPADSADFPDWVDDTLSDWLAENEWHVVGDECYGKFRTGLGNFDGCLGVNEDGIQAWVRNPPSWFTEDGRGECWEEPDEDGWAELDFIAVPPSVVEAVRGVEKYIISEAPANAS